MHCACTAVNSTSISYDVERHTEACPPTWSRSSTFEVRGQSFMCKYMSMYKPHVHRQHMKHNHIIVRQAIHVADQDAPNLATNTDTHHIIVHRNITGPSPSSALFQLFSCLFSAFIGRTPCQPPSYTCSKYPCDSASAQQ